ncbi:replication protein RepA [Runella zeae]|uniref:replication protein RepA n=1 Tax=Runella zeae TaxID=94255 RepID=UPI00041F2E61|nr:replication protein RepA [Runella zeae]
MAKLRANAENNRPVVGRKASKPKLVKTLQEVSLTAPLASEVVYQHSLLCQVAMPASDPKKERYWHVTNGRNSLMIQSGSIVDQRTNKIVEVGLPYGVTARLLFINLVSQILKNKKKYMETGSRVINIEDSMSSFIKRLGFPVTAHYIKNVKEQILRMSRAQFTFVLGGENNQIYEDIKLFSKHDLWYPQSSEQLGLWPSLVEPTREFTEFVIRYAVPLDERAVSRLTEGALALDIYAWLAHRLCRVEQGTPDFVNWKNLYEIYGKGYKKINKFKERFREALEKVLHVYPAAANAVTEGICIIKSGHTQKGRYSGFWLEYTTPPVPFSEDYKPHKIEGKKVKYIIDAKPIKNKRVRAELQATVYSPPTDDEFLKMSQYEKHNLPVVRAKTGKKPT